MGMNRILSLLAKPSTYIRGLWLAVIALHAWLFMRRIIGGDWFGLLNQARLVFALVACIYGAVRMWRPATFLDDSPRKALAFTLLLIIGHFGVSSENYRRIAEETVNGVEWNHVVLVTTVLIVAAASITLGMALQSLPGHRARQVLIPIRPHSHYQRYSSHFPSHYQRPPPRG